MREIDKELFEAVFQKDYYSVLRALDNGACVNAFNKWRGVTPLLDVFNYSSTVDQRKTELRISKLLIDRGADARIPCASGLTFVVLMDNSNEENEALEYALTLHRKRNKPIDLNKKNTSSALNSAIFVQNIERVKLLLKFGLKPQPLDMYMAIGSIDFSNKNSEQAGLEIVKQLIKYGVDVNGSYQSKYHLHDAVEIDQTGRLTRLFLQHGASDSLKIGPEMTVRDLMDKKGHINLHELLEDSLVGRHYLRSKFTVIVAQISQNKTSALSL